MLQLKVRLGPKGQVVIPKIFRNEFKLIPGNEVIITVEEDKGVLITNAAENIAEKFEDIAKTIKKDLSVKTIKKILDKQYEERTRKAGIEF